MFYAKLPSWFKVPTPVSSFNPDWAVLVEEDGTRRLFFMVETKSSLFTDDTRDTESAKLEYRRAFHERFSLMNARHVERCQGPEESHSSPGSGWRVALAGQLLPPVQGLETADTQISNWLDSDSPAFSTDVPEEDQLE